MAAAAVAVLVGVLQLTSPSRAVATHDLPCPDVDGNGQVTLTDLDLAAFFFGQFVPPGTGADADGSGQVTIFDIMIIVSAIGTTTNCQDAPVHGPGNFPGQGDDLTPSLGTFRIVVAEDFRAAFAGCSPPLWDGVSRLESPTLSDAATKIGRSAVHIDGDGSDTGGTSVGTAGTIISDGDFSLVPQGFEGPPGTREIHTEVRTLNLTGGGAAVRAGTAAPARPISPGEVEAQSGGSDFPADSFFNVFVEVDLPDLTGVCGTFPGATLYNAGPLIVRNSKIEFLPPKVVYLHDNTTAVPVLFKGSNPPSWQADDLFGHLVLAGHGVNFDINNPADLSIFEDFVAAPGNVPEMPLPGVGGIAELPDVAGTPLETGGSSGPNVGILAGSVAGFAAGAVALGGAAWYLRRRR